LIWRVRAGTENPVFRTTRLPRIASHDEWACRDTELYELATTSEFGPASSQPKSQICISSLNRRRNEDGYSNASSAAYRECKPLCCEDPSDVDQREVG